MKKRYIFLVAIAILLGLGLVFLPEKSNHKQVDANNLLLTLKGKTGFLSSDEVAKLIISKDPTLLLVDVRSEAAYENFSLEGSLNVPLDELLEDSNKDYFSREELQIVLYSNGGTLAEQAWILLRREGYENIYLLEGGLNRWTETIMQPQEPAETASEEAFNLYDFRKAACKYFAGGSIPITPTYEKIVEKKAPAKKKVVKVIPKVVVEEEEEEEGC